MMRGQNYKSFLPHDYKIIPLMSDVLLKGLLLCQSDTLINYILPHIFGPYLGLSVRLWTVLTFVLFVFSLRTCSWTRMVTSRLQVSLGRECSDVAHFIIFLEYVASVYRHKSCIHISG